MEFIVYTLSVVIILSSIYHIFYVDKLSYSLNKFIWFYILLFWGIVPLIQYSFKIFPWETNVTTNSALTANSLIILWMIAYKFSYQFKKKTQISKNDLFPIYKYKISLFGIVFLILIQLLIFLFLFSLTGKLTLLRGEASDIVISSNLPLQLIMEMVLRAITTFVLFIFIICFIQNKIFFNAFFLFISFTLLLFTNFPLALPRYMAGAFYIGIVFIFKPFFKRKYFPIFALLMLFLVIYPALSFLRNITSFSDWEMNYSSLSSFLSEDFDNYSTLNMTIFYVAKHGVTFGQQLLGVLLFFIPRSFWPSKPIGTGSFIAESQNMAFTNISCPYVAEGYINFGFLGVIIFAVVMGFFVSSLDFKFYQSGKVSPIKLFYPVSLGMIIFILRGDLMSSFAYTISFIIAAIIVFHLSKPFLLYKNIG